MTWQLQNKNKFSQVVDTTLAKEPQIISRHCSKETQWLLLALMITGVYVPEPKLNFKQWLQKPC